MSIPDAGGVLLVDKPRGPTSFDVVRWARRALRTREIGHTGTLDPMATGMLAILVGNATRLSSWLTSERKVYRAEITLHTETDSLDADGVITRTLGNAADPSRVEVERAVAAMVGPQMQVPPVVSAIKIDGVAAHERVRRGETLDLPARSVELIKAQVLDVQGHVVQVELVTSKGFYVRSFARDLAQALGTVAHLTALRRVSSGLFSVTDALDGRVLERAASRDESAEAAVRSALRSVTELETTLPSLRVSLSCAHLLSHGKRAPREEPWATLALGEKLALCDSPGGLIAVGIVQLEEDGVTVVRNFPTEWLRASAKRASDALMDTAETEPTDLSNPDAAS
ncbi:MAG: tRNA pseudouridine(55) synthase TruB [Deltaproteobacteria bacterium]|nr:tRNA pseudouridine(55) synthase TruB [Deltaproteobacteria bacterium]